eukprot:4811562-Prymnesium_polylepis.2
MASMPCRGPAPAVHERGGTSSRSWSAQPASTGFGSPWCRPEDRAARQGGGRLDAHTSARPREHCIP